MEQGAEIISNEDMLGNLENLNERMKKWHPGMAWNGVCEGKYYACGNCVGTKDGWNNGKPEVCTCMRNGQTGQVGTRNSELEAMFYRTYQKLEWGKLKGYTTRKYSRQ